jgi:exopolysaccharide biosynthesis predicted pyruvyltransferase EpsI
LWEKTQIVDGGNVYSVEQRDEFEAFLRENRSLRVCAVTPGGNHGDTLIHMGLVKKMEELGIDYTCRNLEETYDRDRVVGAKYLMNIAADRVGVRKGFRLLDIPADTELILFEGGGYMNDIWYGLTLIRQILRRHEQPVAVGPHSFWFRRPGFLELFRGERPVTIFCRERYSIDLLRGEQVPPNVRLGLSKDTALYLSSRDLEDLVEQKGEDYDLVCFRNDRESIVSEATKREIIGSLANPLVEDISKKGDLMEFVSAVAGAARVYTDRLHVAIAAHILGRRARLYGNRYHKNRGVYEYSLRSDPGIEFIE